MHTISNYIILTLLNINPIIGGKFVAVIYINITKLNPFLSILTVIFSEIIICAIAFHFANYFRKIGFFKKRLEKMNDEWIKKGVYIGFFVGQIFIGELFVALLFGLVEDKKKKIGFFYIPMIASTVLYTLIYYYMAVHGINFIKSYTSIDKQINAYKNLF
jgi:hypothetical protein